MTESCWCIFTDCVQCVPSVKMIMYKSHKQ